MVFNEGDTSPPVTEEHIQLTPPAKVRVTYYESQKPHFVTTPDSSELSFKFLTLSSTMASSEDVQRYISMNTGMDNPFRPDGALSREAECLIKHVQSGQPLTTWSSRNQNTTPSTPLNETQFSNSPEAPAAPAPAVIEIQHGIVVPPASPSNVEQVKIKKKPKCYCCVIL